MGLEMCLALARKGNPLHTLTEEEGYLLPGRLSV